MTTLVSPPTVQPIAASEITSRSMSIVQEEALLSCLLADPDTFEIVQDLVSWPDFTVAPSEAAAGRSRKALAEGIWACQSQVPALTVNRPNVLDSLRVLGYLDTRVSAQYVQHLDDRGTSDVLRGRVDYAQRVAVLGRARRVYKKATQFVEDVRSAPDEVDSITEHFVTEAEALVSSGRVSRDPTSHGILTTPVDTSFIPTGFTRLDQVARVLTPGRITGIMALQGGRKTATALNFVLGPLYRGASVAYFSFRDNTRAEIMAQMVAMRATSLLRHWHVTGERYDCPPESWVLSPEGLYKYFQSRAQLAAIVQARDEFGIALDGRFRVYDAEDGIIELGQTLAVSRADLRKYRGQIYVYDYMQGLEDVTQREQSDYTLMRAATKKLHRFTTEHRVATIMVSQLNKEETIRGGGDLRDAAAVLIRIGYNSSDRPDAITYSLEKGRFSALADGKITHEINPSSGLILNPAATQNEGDHVGDYAT